MLIHVLGPLAVTEGGLVVDVGPPRVRRALARLLVADGAPVSIDAIADAVWQGGPLPKRPDKAVQDLIADLRRGLPGDGGRVQTGPDRRSYGLVLQASELDATLAAWDVSQGRHAIDARDPSRALVLFDAALDRYRGRPFEGFDDEFVRADVLRLDELYRDAVEGRLAASVALRSTLDAGDFASATASAPTRWRPWASWMLWLARDGRGADALRVFQTAVHAFAELGLDAPRELRALDERVARDDATFDDVLGTLYGTSAPRRVPPALAEAIGVRLVGRDGELATLRHRWADTVRGRFTVVEVTGEEGAGKSSLVGAFAREVADGGGLVLGGRAAQVTAVSYQPIAEALGTHVDNHPDAARSLLDEHPELRPLERIVTSLSTGEVARGGDATAERRAMFVAASSYLARLAADHPVLVVLDDLHWIDLGSAHLLEHLLGALDASQPVMVVLAYRDDEIRLAHPLRPVLAQVVRMDVERVALAGLGGGQLTELLRLRFPEVADADALGASLRRLTEGNPLFVEEVLRQLDQLRASAVVMDQALVEHLHTPEGVRALVLRRLGALDPATARVLGAAAVVGNRFSAAQLAACGVGGPDAVLDALDDAVAAGLIVDPGDGTADLLFRHSFYRGVVYDGLIGVRRADLHHRVARWMLGRGVRDRTVAHHLLNAGALADPVEVTTVTCAAALGAAAQLDMTEARERIARLLALLVADTGPTEVLQARAWSALASAERLSGDVPATKAAALAAWKHALAGNDADVLVDAAIEHATFGGERRADDETSIELLHRSLALVTEPRHRARLLSRIAYHHAMWTPGSAEAVGTSRTALALAEELDDDQVTAFALWAAAASLQGGPAAGERRDLGERLLDLAERSGDDRTRANADRVLVLSGLELGDAAQFEASLADMVAVADRTRSWIYHADIARWQAMRAMLRGEWDLARAEADRQREIGGSVSIYPASWAAQRAFLHRAVGELAQARALLDRAVSALADAPALAAFRAVLALVAAEQGAVAVRDNHFWALADDGLAGVEHGRTYPTTLVSLAETCALMGQRDVAPLLLDALEPFAGQLVVVSWGEACLGAADRYRGMLLGTLGRTDDAVVALEAACVLERKADAPALEAVSQAWLERTRRRGGTGA